MDGLPLTCHVCRCDVYATYGRSNAHIASALVKPYAAQIGAVEEQLRSGAHVIMLDPRGKGLRGRLGLVQPQNSQAVSPELLRTATLSARNMDGWGCGWWLPTVSTSVLVPGRHAGKGRAWSAGTSCRRGTRYPWFSVLLAPFASGPLCSWPSLLLVHLLLLAVNTNGSFHGFRL